uniref:Uncharacterized protein n=1 Tax=Malurus cyaneus samueli TaxID=2593467 RepID=A0A8C5TZL6_9PASS
MPGLVWALADPEGALGLAFPGSTHVAEDHGLGDGDGTIDVTESPELLISVIAQHVILLDGVQGLLLTLQLDNVWEHLASVPLNADALVLVALRGDHHICLIQHKHLDLLGIYELQFGTPVQHGAPFPHSCLWCFPLLTFVASNSVREFQLRVKVSHLFNHFSCLKCQLVCWGKAQTLEEQKDNE